VNGPIKYNPVKTEKAIAIRRLIPAREVRNSEIERAVRLASAGNTVRSVSVVLGDDAMLAALHERYMADASPTDVLTFDLRDDEAGPIEGEIVVSVETARRQARRRRIEAGRELLRYVIHGTLHLVGYDDRTAVERRRMRAAEDRVLALLKASKLR
jgi:probable rRNA maturation factor